MTVALDHLSVATRDNMATAAFYAQIFGVSPDAPRRDFAPVTLTDGLTLNFENAEEFEPRHYAFRVPADEFEAVLQRVVAASVPFGSSTRDKNGEVYDHDSVRGFYFQDPNGHGLEILTRP